MNIKECVIFGHFFIPPKDFKEFYESIGYSDSDIVINEDMSFDPRIVQYVKDHNNWHAWDKAKYAMRGAPSSLFKIGFAGAATVIEVDVDRTWKIGYHNGDVPYPIYIEIKRSKYGRLVIK